MKFIQTHSTTCLVAILFTILNVQFTIAQNVSGDSLVLNELTLKDAINVALANNSQIQRAALSVEDAQELVKIARSDVYPNISSSLSYTRNFEIPVQFLPAEIFGGQPGTLIPVSFGTDNNWQGGVTVSQNIFKGDVLVALSTSSVFKSVQEENLRAVSQQIITQTRIAYYQILAAREQLRLQQAQIERLEENLKTNVSLLKAGLVDEYSVLQLEVQLSNQRPLLIEAEYALKESYRNLKIVMGIPHSFNFEVKGNLNEYDILSSEAEVEENAHLKVIDQLNPFTFSKDVPTDKLLSSRGDLRVLEASLELKDKEILSIKSRFLPSITATYNRMWTAAQAGTPVFFENETRFQTLSLNVSLPIFEGFRRFAEIQRAKISKKDIEQQKWQARLMAEHEIISAGEVLNKIFETAEARREALEIAKTGYDRALKRLENGLGSQTEANDAELQVHRAEVNYALMVFEYLTAKAQYDLATGNVPFADIELNESNLIK